MTPVALFALATAAFFCFAAWCDKVEARRYLAEAREERAAARDDLDTIRMHRQAMEALESRRRATAAGHPSVGRQVKRVSVYKGSVADEAERWLEGRGR